MSVVVVVEVECVHGRLHCSSGGLHVYTLHEDDRVKRGGVSMRVLCLGCTGVCVWIQSE